MIRDHDIWYLGEKIARNLVSYKSFHFLESLIFQSKKSWTVRQYDR